MLNIHRFTRQKAGFDMIELHAASCYLINQLMSLYNNKRQDEYGGSTENRARFSVEIKIDYRGKW
ncbi:oxidoreductase [Paenibacillus sp. FSL L8-0463]|uniref:oxidoreductase n=1 Tax=Paenibacillus sp. FSL L8-0463 TaxID=2954687 RepID=UPI004053830F